MRKVYYLSTCTTCKRIMEGLYLEGFEMQDIKVTPLSEVQLTQLYTAVGSFEALFSKRAIKYKTMGLKEKGLTEQDYKELLLQEYTFLKRPVFVIGDRVFVGNSKKTIEALTIFIENEFNS